MNGETDIKQPLAHDRLDLREETLGRTIWSLALPTIVETLLVTMVFFSDTLIVGWLRDEKALAATMLAGLIMFFLDAPFFALSAAANSLVARSWGQRDFDGARRFAGHSIYMAFCAAAGFIIIAWPLSRGLVTVLGASEAVIPLGTKYLRILLFSGALGMPMFVSNAIIRGTGDTKTPMINTAMMNVTNVVVSIVLAFGMGVVEPMGLIGVAWGTVIARTLGGALSLRALFSRRKNLQMRFANVITLSKTTSSRIVRLSTPAVLERSVQSLGSLVFIRIVAILGTTTLAAHNIAIHVESLAYMPLVGVGSAIAAIVGQALGAGRSHIAELAVKRTLLWSAIFMVGLAVLFVVFGPVVAKVFGATPDVVKLAGMALQIASLELPCLAVYLVLAASLRGAGDTRSPLYVTLVCSVLFRLGGVYLFAITFGWGLAGVWFATALDWGMRGIGLWICFRKGVWKLIHEQEEGKYT